MGSSGTKQEKEEIITKDIITKKHINLFGLTLAVKHSNMAMR